MMGARLAAAKNKCRVKGRSDVENKGKCGGEKKNAMMEIELSALCHKKKKPVDMRRPCVWKN